MNKKKAALAILLVSSFVFVGIVTIDTTTGGMLFQYWPVGHGNGAGCNCDNGGGTTHSHADDPHYCFCSPDGICLVEDA